MSTTDVPIGTELRNAIERHSDGGEFARAETDVVIESLVESGYERDHVEQHLETLLKYGELYQVDGTIGVV